MFVDTRNYPTHIPSQNVARLGLRQPKQRLVETPLFSYCVSRIYTVSELTTEATLMTQECLYNPPSMRWNDDSFEFQSKEAVGAWACVQYARLYGGGLLTNIERAFIYALVAAEIDLYEADSNRPSPDNDRLKIELEERIEDLRAKLNITVWNNIRVRA